ncbi:MAG: DNA repair protein RecN [Phycisphaera sp.]|nr:DNA repair protein RecN [Phycisphaera sp.]
MLRELHISNLAVIEDVRLDLCDGLNCFTGQTGAGKSLILGAFEVLLGLRSTELGQMLRPGAQEARVSGVFEVHDERTRAAVAQVADLAEGDAHELLITRKVFASGRTSATVNGQPATAAMVRAIGETLVDIHGQHDHQYLLRPSNQLSILDAYGRCEDLREQFAEHHRTLGQLQQRLAELSASRTLRKQQLDLYEFQADEIDDAAVVAGEYEELRARQRMLANVQRLVKDASSAHAALYETDGSVVERLQMIVHLLNELTQLDAGVGPIAEQVRTATLVLQDSSFDLSRYVERLEANPGELAEVEDRLDTLNRLMAKYCDTSSTTDAAGELLAYRQDLEAELTRLRGENEDLTQLEKQIQSTRTQMDLVGRKLTKARHAAATDLCPKVGEHLKELGMAEAELSVEFVEDQASATGLESIEMLVRTNPGQPARPLRKIASGGELSRIMLALKSILAQSDRISVLVFDEIDANIGGRMGTVIGQKLRALSRQSQQVLCITHLPQIAAYADRHLRIAKRVEGTGPRKQTVTGVTVLEGQARVEELAEMLAGNAVTPTTRKQVKEMLQGAN